MTVKELIKKLEAIANKDLEVMVLPDAELAIDSDLMAYGCIGNVEEQILYLDENGFDNVYKEYDQFIEDHEQELEDHFGVEGVETLTDEQLKKWVETHEKMHAVIIEATP